MGTTTIIFLIFLAISILYGIFRSKYQPIDTILDVEAGPTEYADATKFVHTSGMAKTIQLLDGRYINSHDYIRIHINGSCMKPRNILSGEEWLVKPVNKKQSPRSQLNKRDVLLIYIEDKKLYKIRELDSFEPNNQLKTFWYEDNGNQHESSQLHRWESVIGVVKYAI